MEPELLIDNMPFADLDRVLGGFDGVGMSSPRIVRGIRKPRGEARGLDGDLSGAEGDRVARRRDTNS